MAETMKMLSLVLAVAACDPYDYGTRQPYDDGTNHPPDAGPYQPPPPPQAMSDLHLEPGGAQLWLIHSALDADHAPTTSHLAVYRPEDGQLADVLDTTGTVGQKIAFPANDRVLLVTRRADHDVLVSIDTVRRRPVAQRSYEGELSDWQVSPSGRLLLARDLQNNLQLFDGVTLTAVPVTGSAGYYAARWSAQGDRLYVALFDRLVRYDLDGVDLAAPLAMPVTLATGGFGSELAVSADERFAAVDSFEGPAPHVALIELATGAVELVEGVAPVSFTRDDRAVVLRGAWDDAHEVRLVDPRTGVAGPAIATMHKFRPSTFALTHHDRVITSPMHFAPGVVSPSLMIDTRTGAATQLAAGVHVDAAFERADATELWLFDEDHDAIERLDLTTGALSAAETADSVQFRPAHADAFVGTFAPSVRHLSLTTGRFDPRDFAVPSPLDVIAPYQLAD